MLNIFRIIITICLLYTSSLQLQWLDQFQFAGYYIAKEKGFYKEAGLDVILKKYNNIAPVTEVINNNATYGVGRSTLIIDKSNGANIKLLATIFQSSPSVFISRKESNISSVKDFSGKSMMITDDAATSVPQTL